MNKFISITLLLSTMGFFNIFNKAEKIDASINSPIVGMILLEEANSLNINNMIREIEENLNLEIESKELGDDALVFRIDGHDIAIAEIPLAIPGDEVKITAEYSYFWEDAINEAPNHKAHIILSIINAGKNSIQENILFNQIATSILKNSKSMGIYIGGRTLLLKKDFYLSNSETMSESNLPVYNWIYFGLKQEKGKQSIYTYGLADFGKKEMEIVNSKQNLNTLSEMMYNLTNYVLTYDVTLKDGETIGISAKQKLKITESKGKFLEGKTLKIKF